MWVNAGAINCNLFLGRASSRPRCCGSAPQASMEGSTTMAFGTPTAVRAGGCSSAGRLRTRVRGCFPHPRAPAPSVRKRARASITTGASSTPRDAVRASASAVDSTRAEPSAVAKDLDVVITHSSADFDSLAAAVGLAKLRGNGTMVVTPGGEGPALRRFLALHRQLFEIVDVKTVDPNRLRWVGVVDTVRKDRLGVAAEWPALADEVTVFDHHVGRVCDITNERKLTVVVDAVGAVATLITERLKEEGHTMTPGEATLLALAIHSDTGNLTYESTTPRDAAALAWLMANGAVQRSISEFSMNTLSDDQQRMLSKGLAAIKRRRVHGVEIGSVVLVDRQFLKGMSTIATNLLDLSGVDVILLVFVNCRGRRAQKRKRNNTDDDLSCGLEDLRQVSVIGRARARVDGIDFNKLFAPLGGGGHERAASASLKLTEEQAYAMTERLVTCTVESIPEPKTVTDHMTRNVVTVRPSDTLQHALGVIKEGGKKGLPVVDEYGVLQGMITLKDIRQAQYKVGAKAMRRPVAGFMHQNLISVSPTTPFHEASVLVQENSLGRLPVVDEKHRLVGLVTRTDVLVAQRMWSNNISAE